MADHKYCKKYADCNWRKSVGNCPDNCNHFKHKDEVILVHGRWAALDDDCEELEGEDEAMRWGCSACHEVVDYDDWTHRSRLTRFCPNCGAKMDGDADA